MGKFEKDAKDLLEYVGGKENINAVSHCVTRMRFVLVDSKKADIDKIESLITPKTSAIVGVHVYGFPCDVEKIDKIAKNYNLKVIYDAAHAFSTEIDGKGIGAFGDITMFSFHATKLFNTIEGGCLTYNNPELVKKVYNLRNFGIRSEELVEDISNLNSNLNRTNSDDVDETFDNLYSDINAVREAEDDVTDESINVNGKEYTYVSSSGDFTSFTGGVGISGTIDIKVPKVNYSYEDDLLDPGSLTVRPIRVSSIDFGLHIDETSGVSVNDDLLTNLEAIGANVRISEENGKYFLNYTAYYNRSELANALGLTSGSNVQNVIEAIQLDVQYNLIYQYSTEITLTKRNLNKFTNYGLQDLLSEYKDIEKNRRVEFILIENSNDMNIYTNYINKLIMSNR